MYKFMGEGILNVPPTGGGHKDHVTTGQKKKGVVSKVTDTASFSFTPFLSL